MRIAFFHTPSDIYGASKSLLRLTSRLVKDQHFIVVVLTSNGPLKTALESKGVKVIIQSSLSYYTRKDFKTIRGVIRFICTIPISVLQIIHLVRNYRIDILHTNVALIISPGIASKLVRKLHYWHVRESFSEFGTLLYYYQWILYLFSSKLLCVSGPIANQFPSKRVQKKTIVLHNGFPKTEFKKVSEKIQIQLRNKYHISDEITLGVIGRIKFERKGQEIFCHAAKLLLNEMKGVKFFIIGSPFPGNESHLYKLKQLITKMQLTNNVILTGEVENPYPYYQLLDIIVLPSVTPEPFGGVVIESMAFRKPVIGTKIGGTIEQIEDKKTGILVNPGDSFELFVAMHQLCRDKKMREEMGWNARKRYLENFEFEQFYQKVLNIYGKTYK